MYRIEKGIALPAKQYQRSKYSDIPLENMDIGDSIKLVDITHFDDYNGTASRFRIGVLVASKKKKLCGNYRVGIRKIHNKKELRVWRTN